MLDEMEGESAKSFYFFDECHINRNVSLRMKAGDGVNRKLKCEKVSGDKSGRIEISDGQEAFFEEDQEQTKTDINIWIGAGARAYMAPLVFILGNGEIAFKWDGEIISVLHLRIVPGRVIEIDQNAMTSSIKDNVYDQGVKGAFKFASFTMGSRAVLGLPSPMPLLLTVGILVSVNTENKSFTIYHISFVIRQVFFPLQNSPKSLYLTDLV